MKKKAPGVKTAVRKNRPAAEPGKKPVNAQSGSLSPIQKMHLAKAGIDKRYL